MSEDEMLPDMPSLIFVLEETMAEFNDMDDLGSITKRKLALNQELVYDALIQISRYIVTVGYKTDLLDKLIARKKTAKIDEEDEDYEEPVEIEEGGTT